MRKTFVLAAALALVLAAGCRSVERGAPAGGGVVGEIVATPFAFVPNAVPGAAETSFFNPRMRWYEVVRPVDDSARVLFFRSQAEADAYVRARFETERRPGVPLFDSWPAPLRRGENADVFAHREQGEYLRSELAIILDGTLVHPDFGDTGHPVFAHELSGRMTGHFVYIRYGHIPGARRLLVLSANLHFQSVWWGTTEAPR